jgi:hypothetical protein
VRVWKDRVMNFGNTTTNSVESSHARLKKYLMNSLGDFCKNWERMDNMLTNILIETKKEFQHSIIIKDKKFDGKCLVVPIARKYFIGSNRALS